MNGSLKIPLGLRISFIALAVAIMFLLTMLVAFEANDTSPGSGANAGSNGLFNIGTGAASLPLASGDTLVVGTPDAGTQNASGTSSLGFGPTNDATSDNSPLATGRIGEVATPLAETSPAPGSWALLNLICVGISLVWSIVLLIGLIISYRNRDERLGAFRSIAKGAQTVNYRKRRNGRIIGIAIGVAALLVFAFTENMALPTTWVDFWSPVMVIFLIIQDVVTLYAVIYKESDEEDALPLSQQLSWKSFPRI
jgi:hypothetical protein